MSENELKIDERLEKFFNKPETKSVVFDSIHSTLLAGLVSSAESASVAAEMMNDAQQSDRLRDIAKRFSIAISAEQGGSTAAVPIGDIAAALENIGNEFGIPK